MKTTLLFVCALTFICQCTTEDVALQEMSDQKSRSAAETSKKNAKSNLMIEMIIYEGFEETYEATLEFDGKGYITIEGSENFAGTYTLPVNFQDEYRPGIDVFNVQGKLNQIAGLRFFSYQGAFKTFTGVEHLKALRKLELELHGPTLDLRQNKKLEHMSIGIQDVSDLVLPASHSIQFFYLRTNAITIEQYVAILDNVHSNAMRTSTKNGVFSITITEEIEQYINENPDVANKLRELRDVLGWEVSDI